MRNLPSVPNLASHRFQSERLENVTLGTIAACLLCALLALLAIFAFQESAANHLRAAAKTRSYQLAELQRQQRQYSRILGRPENVEVFDWSVLLNEIITRRGVSWVKVFHDLADVMPPNMRLIGIRLPQVAADELNKNRVELDMVVASDQPAVIVNLLNALEKDTRFGPATVVSEVAPTEKDSSSKFRVLVTYGQTL